MKQVAHILFGFCLCFVASGCIFARHCELASFDRHPVLRVADTQTLQLEEVDARLFQPGAGGSSGPDTEADNPPHATFYYRTSDPTNRHAARERILVSGGWTKVRENCFVRTEVTTLFGKRIEMERETIVFREFDDPQTERVQYRKTSLYDTPSWIAFAAFHTIRGIVFLPCDNEGWYYVPGVYPMWQLFDLAEDMMAATL